MRDEDALAMAIQYRKSLYDMREDPTRMTRGTRVPKVTGAELVAAMEENVEQARAWRDRVKDRMDQATRDGLFDVDAMEATKGEKARLAWLEAIQVMHGDKVRCVAELNHWRGYLAWAMRKAAREMPSREPGSDDE